MRTPSWIWSRLKIWCGPLKRVTCSRSHRTRTKMWHISIATNPIIRTIASIITNQMRTWLKMANLIENLATTTRLYPMMVAVVVVREAVAHEISANRTKVITIVAHEQVGTTRALCSMISPLPLPSLSPILPINKSNKTLSISLSHPSKPWSFTRRRVQKPFKRLNLDLRQFAYY